MLLHNAVGGGRASDFPEKSIMTMYGPMILASVTRGWVGVEFPEKKLYITLEVEWPLDTKLQLFI